MFNNIYKEKKVLITGHTGFKGAWLSAWLLGLGAEVIGISLPENGIPNHFDLLGVTDEIKDIRGDIRDPHLLKLIVDSEKPDFIFHLAAQALVFKSYDDPLLTWQTNTIGTINLLEALKTIDFPCVAIFITSDKCYENIEWIWGYREIDKLGGADPYSASKAAAEIAISSYFRSFFSNKNKFVSLASARAGNVIGGGDWSEHRIVPDIVSSWKKGEKISLRNPNSTRPWQHVLEPLSGYLTLGATLYIDRGSNGESFNFGPSIQKDYSVSQIVEEMSNYFVGLSWEDCSMGVKNYEAGLLKLNCDKALNLLNWHAALDFKETIKLTADWYLNFARKNVGIFELTTSQIKYYVDSAEKQGIVWATSN